MPKSPRYRGFNHGIGDESNSPVLEILVGGECGVTDSRALHVAAADDADTDWNVAASTHPIFFVHSATTPATDYISMTHDGASAVLDAVGATAFDLNIDGLEVLSFAPTASAVNEVTVTNAAACGAPDISATGGDTNITLALTTKGTGHFRFDNGGTESFGIHDTTCNPVTASASGVGHPIFMYTAPGLASSGATAATAGGLWTLETGVGGIGTDACNQAGANGGALSLVTGIGGASSACDTSAGGAGGALCVTTGAGGVAATSCSGNAGAGGALTVTGGNAGAITGGTGAPAIGGVVSLISGVGSTSNVACDISGAGGLLSAAGGAGGAGTGSGASGNGGVGGQATLSAGAGGASTSGGGGNGGVVDIFAGQGGTGTGGSAGGCAGDVNIHLGTAVEGGAIGEFKLVNETTGLGIPSGTECSCNVINAAGSLGSISYMGTWQTDWVTAADTGVLLIQLT